MRPLRRASAFAAILASLCGDELGSRVARFKSSRGSQLGQSASLHLPLSLLLPSLEELISLVLPVAVL